MKADEIKEIDLVELAELIENHMAEEVPRYIKLYDLYKGKHAILEREEKKNKPNNKIIADFYGKLVDTEIGYFLGHPIVFNTEQEGAREQLEIILVENEFDDLILEIGKEMSIKGKTYLLVYQDEESFSRIDKLSPDNVITISATKGRDKIGVGVRYYTEIEKDDKGNEITTQYIELYDSSLIKYYVMQDGIIIENKDKQQENHIYGQVPIIEMKNNEEEMGSFEKVISIVEAYDKLISDTSNEHEAYRNAYLVLKNISLDSEAQAKLGDSSVLEIFDDGEAYFLQKPIQDNATTSQLNRLSDDIHRFTDIVDMGDEKFGGNLSGVAIRFKLLGLENKCIIKERKMSKGIRNLIRCLNKALVVSSGEEIDIIKLDINFTRNLPNNLTEIVDTVTKLDGLIDKETLLSLLPFVDNPKEVIEKLEEEQDTYAKDMENYNNKKFGESGEMERPVNPEKETSPFESKAEPKKENPFKLNE